MRIECTSPSRNITLYYRTTDMMIPQLLYAKNAEEQEVACSVSLVPTFEAVAP